MGHAIDVRGAGGRKAEQEGARKYSSLTWGDGTCLAVMLQYASALGWGAALNAGLLSVSPNLCRFHGRQAWVLALLLTCRPPVPLERKE